MLKLTYRKDRKVSLDLSFFAAFVMLAAGCSSTTKSLGSSAADLSGESSFYNTFISQLHGEADLQSHIGSALAMTPGNYLSFLSHANKVSLDPALVSTLSTSYPSLRAMIAPLGDNVAEVSKTEVHQFLVATLALNASNPVAASNDSAAYDKAFGLVMKVLVYASHPGSDAGLNLLGACMSTGTPCTDDDDGATTLPSSSKKVSFGPDVKTNDGTTLDGLPSSPSTTKSQLTPKQLKQLLASNPTFAEAVDKVDLANNQWWMKSGNYRETGEPWTRSVAE